MSELTMRLEAAVHALMDDGPIKRRLVTAYVNSLEDLTPVMLPSEASETFMQLQEALNVVDPAGRASRVQASVQKMSQADASAHARTILELYRLVVLAARRGDHLKVIELVGQDSPPPRFLVGSN